MRIGIFHNRYLQRGGEDTAVDGESEILEKAGHRVERCIVENRDFVSGRSFGRLRTALRARWNRASEARVEAFLRGAPLDVAHVHNFFPVLSPALHHALSARGVPVVQTLHNYRLVCANGLLLRENRVCEDCVTRGPWNAVRYGCYRGSRLQTAVWSDLVAHHRRLGTWQTSVDRFAVPTEFAKRKLAATAALAPERIEVVPYALADPGPPSPPGRGAAFVGRLSEEKGVDLLIDAWRGIEAPLVIVGSGPAERELRARASGNPAVRFLGARPHDDALRALRAAAFAVVPSRWYEISPFAAIEAMACGRGVIAWGGGALAELVEDGRSGLFFDALDPESLGFACRRLLADHGLVARLGAGARERYVERHAPEAALGRLERLYRSARAARVERLAAARGAGESRDSS